MATGAGARGATATAVWPTRDAMGGAKAMAEKAKRAWIMGTSEIDERTRKRAQCSTALTCVSTRDARTAASLARHGTDASHTRANARSAPTPTHSPTQLYHSSFLPGASSSAAFRFVGHTSLTSFEKPATTFALSDESREGKV